MNQETTKKIDADVEKRLREAFASVDLDIDDEAIKRSQPSVEAMIHRIATGQTTGEQEEARLLEEWRKLKQ